MSGKRFIVSHGGKLLFPALSAALAVVAIKTAIHAFGWEPFHMTLAPFMTGILTGIVFLLGFILVGTLSDFKESERIPNDLVTSLGAIMQEAEIAVHAHQSEAAERLRRKVVEFATRFIEDFLLRNDHHGVTDLVESFSEEFRKMDAEGVPPNFMARLRQEQSNVTRMITRIVVIRETTFLQSGYAVIYVAIAAFFISLIFLRMEPFGQGLSLLALYAFLLTAVIFLIRDMDNPFEYRHGIETTDEVGFGILLEYIERWKRRMPDRGKYQDSVGIGREPVVSRPET